jgi:RNA polymerase sigma-70 factor (ECF subfamily)
MAAKGPSPEDRRSLFEREVIPHLDSLFNAALRLTRNPDDAGDLSQEAVLRAWRFFHQYEPGTNCRAWLLTIAYNLFRNGYRRTRELPASTAEEFERRSAVESATASSIQPPETQIMDRSLDEEVERALEALPEEFRTAILLIDVDELSYEETARVLEIPTGTVKSRVSRGRAELRRRLGTFAEARRLNKPGDGR